MYGDDDEKPKTRKYLRQFVSNLPSLTLVNKLPIGPYRIIHPLTTHCSSSIFSSKMRLPHTQVME